MPSASKATLPDNLAVRIEDLSISYKVNVESKKTLKNAIMRASKGERVRTRTVEAVKHLNLDIPHGAVVGIVGANGAGKSTLMRSIAGILPPTTGKITVNGRISTLLAIGVGFVFGNVEVDVSIAFISVIVLDGTLALTPPPV